MAKVPSSSNLSVSLPLEEWSAEQPLLTSTHVSAERLQGLGRGLRGGGVAAQEARDGELARPRPNAYRLGAVPAP